MTPRQQALQDHVVELLAESPMRVSMLAERTGCGVREVAGALSALRQLGWVGVVGTDVRSTEKVFGLTD